MPKSLPSLEDIRDRRLYFSSTMAAIGSTIYFLWDDDKVVYVGQSIQPLGRLCQHARGTKIWKYVTILQCAQADLNELENYYIALLKPMYNHEPSKRTSQPENYLRPGKRYQVQLSTWWMPIQLEEAA